MNGRRRGGPERSPALLGRHALGELVVDQLQDVLDAVDELGVGAQVGVVALGEEGDDGDAGVAADDGDVLVLGVGALDLGDEAGGADDVEGGDAEEGLWVVDSAELVDFTADWDGGVDLFYDVSGGYAGGL